MERADINDAKKAIIFEKLAEIDNSLIEGADEYLQLLDLATVLMKQLKWALENLKCRKISKLIISKISWNFIS